jgi:hypothetical protein
MLKIKPQDLNPTTRRYPRTLQEAFPKDDWESVDKTVYKVNPDDVLYLIALFSLGFLLGLLVGEL